MGGTKHADFFSPQKNNHRFCCQSNRPTLRQEASITLRLIELYFGAGDGEHEGQVFGRLPYLWQWNAGQQCTWELGWWINTWTWDRYHYISWSLIPNINASIQKSMNILLYIYLCTYWIYVCVCVCKKHQPLAYNWLNSFLFPFNSTCLLQV